MQWPENLGTNIHCNDCNVAVAAGRVTRGRGFSLELSVCLDKKLGAKAPPTLDVRFCLTAVDSQDTGSQKPKALEQAQGVFASHCPAALARIFSHIRVISSYSSCGFFCFSAQAWRPCSWGRIMNSPAATALKM